MKREDKTRKRLERARRRRARRNNTYKSRINAASEVGSEVPLQAVTRSSGNSWYVSGSWYDSNSPTGYSQKCSYRGVCQSPCNGDC